MAETYKMTIAGVERELPMCAINDKLDIAGFIMFSDVEITVASAKELCNRRYTEYVSKLIDTAMDYGITRLGECGPYTDRITELNSPLF